MNNILSIFSTKNEDKQDKEVNNTKEKLLQEIVNILDKLLILNKKYLFFVGFFIKFVYFNIIFNTYIFSD